MPGRPPEDRPPKPSIAEESTIMTHCLRPEPRLRRRGPRRRAPAVLIAALLLAPVALRPARAAEIPGPEAYFGHPMGADRVLVSYDEYLPYYRLLAERSDRVAIETIGKTVGGRDLVLVTVSAPENLAQLDRYRAISARLNDPRGLSPAGVDSLIEAGKTVLFVSLNIHSTEIGSSQMGMEWVYRLATGGPETAAAALSDVIVLLVPSMNPDGQVLVTEWYRDQLGTPYEGTRPPRLYHPYAGHDDNRDWFMLNLPETRAVNRVLYHRWFPQIVLDEHQMGQRGPRIFVPPYANPLDGEVPPLIMRGADLIGATMALDLEERGKSGVISGFSFDAYWPGGTRSTPWWKNTVGILTEVASPRIATPIQIDPAELEGGRKGLPDYRRQVNYPNPWRGGWWRLRDVVEYELIASDSALRTAARHRRDFLANRARMALAAVHGGERDDPAGFIIPAGQRDPGTASRLVDLLEENGLEVYRTGASATAAGAVVPAGSWVVPAAQPFRPFLMEMMAPRDYPAVRQGPGTRAVYAPYDVTAWCLPELMGVAAEAVPALPDVPLTRVEGPAWTPPPAVPAAGTRWALTPAENDAYAAVFRLLAGGAGVSQAVDSLRAADRALPPGAFLVNASSGEMDKALEGLRARVFIPGATESSEDPPLRTLRLPRVGIYQSWLAPTDEGWTRFALDRFGLPYTVLHNRDIQGKSLAGRFDVVVLPDQNLRQLVDGTSKPEDGAQDTRPAPYAGGLGTAGVAALREFVQRGGTLVTLGEAAELPIREFSLPVSDASAHLGREVFDVPGTLLRAEVDPQHPLGFGMPSEAAVFVTRRPLLRTEPPGPERHRTVVARYAGADRVVADGWAVGSDRLAGMPALVEASFGEGRVVLFAFRPQFRGQTEGTYRMLLNALLDAAAQSAE
jgi:hypothetical protein